MIDRRTLLGSGIGLMAGAAFSRAGFAQALADGTLPPKSPCGIALTALSARLRTPSAGGQTLRENPVAILEFARSLGAGGVQIPVAPEHVPAFRKRLEELGMYYEGQAALPTSRDADLAGFEATAASAAALGATVMRSVSRPPQGSSGRRYEAFKSLSDYRAWQAEADAIVERCLPIAARYKVAIALENHKDRTAEEHLAVLKRFDSEWLGSLIDPGNNMSLMEEPETTVTMLAPYVKATSLKDMGVAPYADGFLLSEVPFGTGMTDQKALFGIMRKANPKLFPTTELITRDPLKVPVKTAGYQAVFAGADKRVASWLRMVEARQTRLPSMEGVDAQARIALEDANNRQVFDWGRANLA